MKKSSEMKEIVFQSKEQNVLEKLHIGVNCNIKESCRCAGKKIKENLNLALHIMLTKLA